MAWSFTSLKYGWKIPTSIALAAVTIYVANNTRWRVNQADVIELALGVHERCLATQTTTNPTYAVAPPSFVRSWYSNSYVTTNVPGDAVTNWTAQLHTNVFTNVIGWRTDRAMMIELDAKIKELVPYYIDTNTVYDGTTNIVMLTVTGVWASLGIGDGTNQFTSIPSWTNNVGETNCTTNAATFGPWAWRNYMVAWQERYKVLNALKLYKAPFAYSVTGAFNKVAQGGTPQTAQGYADVAAIFNETSWSPDVFDNLFYGGAFLDNDYILSWSMVRVKTKLKIDGISNANLTANSWQMYLLVNKYPWPVAVETVFYEEGYGTNRNYHLFQDGSGSPSYPYVTPYIGDVDAVLDLRLDPTDIWANGWRVESLVFLIDWQFSYCTNKYW